LKHPLINMHNSSHLIQFPKIGRTFFRIHFISRKEDLPFIPKRIYWTYFTPEGWIVTDYILELEQNFGLLLLLEKLLCNRIKDGTIEKFMPVPRQGLFIQNVWRTMKYTHNTVQMCIAGMEYDIWLYSRIYGFS
jgi:hypothetical protein